MKKYNQYGLIPFLAVLYASCAYTLDFCGINLPLGLLLLAVLVCIGISIVRERELCIAQKSGIIWGYGIMLIIAIASALCSGFPKAEIKSLQFFYLPFFVLFFHQTIKTRSVLDGILKLVGYIFWASFVLFLFQQFVLGETRDELTGIFGVTTGNQGYTNILFTFYSIYVLAMVFEEKIKSGYAISVIVVSLYQAAVGELKIYFVTLVLTTICLLFLSGITVRKTKIAITVLVLDVLAATILGVIYPRFAGFMAVDSIVETVTDVRGYTVSGDINRLNGIPILIEYMNGFWEILLGLGIGNAGKGSEFYQNYGQLHYTWFAYAYLFVELGFAGLVIYGITHLVDSVKMLMAFRQESDATAKVLYAVSLVYSILFLVWIIYDAKHFTILGAMYNGLFLSLPSIYNKAVEDR